MNNKSGIPWIIAGYGILVLNGIMSDKAWSPKTAISAGIAALGVGAMGNTTLGLRFGQLYFLAIALTHGMELVENIGDAPEKLPDVNSSGKGTTDGKKSNDDTDSNGGGGDSGGDSGGDDDNGGGTNGKKSPYIDPRGV